MNGQVSGDFGLTKAGPGTLILSGGNSYTGGTTISAGTLQIGNGGSGATLGAGTVTNNGTLRFNHTDSLNIIDTINGGLVDKQGAGTLTLGGNVDNVGLGVTVNAGTLVLAKASTGSVHAIGGGGLTINGGTAQLAGTGGDQIWDGAGVTLNGGSFDLNGRSETIGGLNGASGASITSSVAGTSTITVNGGGTYAGTITNGAGTVGLVKAGSGTLILTGSSSFSGGVATNDFGTLAINADAALGATGNGVTFTNGVLRTDAAMTLNRAMTITSGNVGFLHTNGNDVTISGIVSGNGGFIKQGSGVLTLTNNSNSQANNRIDAGVLAFTNDAQLGVTNGTIFLNGGTLRLISGTLTNLNANRNIILHGSSTLEDIGGGSLMTVNGKIDGAFPLTLAGSGPRLLGAVGSTTPLSSLTSTADFPTIGTTVEVGAGGVTIGGINPSFNGAAGLTSVGPITMNSPISTSGGSPPVIRSTGDALTFNNGIYPGFSSFVTLGADTININGNVLNFYGGARFALQAGASDRSIGVGSGAAGTLSISQATLSKFAVGTRTHIGVADQSGLVTVGSSGNGVTFAAPLTLRATAGNVALNGPLSVTGDLAIDAFNLDSASGTTLSASGGVTITNTGTASTLSGAITGVGGLTKSGAGALVLATANSFTGATRITGGTLQAGTAGALGQTSSVQIDSGGTLLLSGTGTTDRINNSAGINLAGGTIAFSGNVIEGSSPGTGALTLSANSSLDLAGGDIELHLGASGGASWTPGTMLSIFNWDDSLDGGGRDRLFFGDASNSLSLTTGQLAQISFFSGGPGSSYLGQRRLHRLARRNQPHPGAFHPLHQPRPARPCRLAPAAALPRRENAA